MSASTPLRVVLFGATGRMGQSVVDVLAADSDMVFEGAVRRAESDGLEFVDANGREDDETLLDRADVAIDFSLPNAVERHLALCGKHKLPYVCGVTGLSASTLEVVSDAAEHMAVVWAPNMSMGVNVCFGAAADIASRLADGFSVSIVDIHHEGKKDAPSGTALEFGRVIQDACSESVNIRYSSVREGTHPGEHHIMFSAGTDVIELRHRAGDRGEFARGAVRAARWLPDQPSGLYNMRNVLGITSS